MFVVRSLGSGNFLNHIFLLHLCQTFILRDVGGIYVTLKLASFENQMIELNALEKLE